MFFDDLNTIENLATKSGFSIFVIPKIPSNLPQESNENHLVITPGENNQINIEQIRKIIEKCRSKQTKPYYIYVYNAEMMNEKAENAFLKLLEEPSENYHFALFTNAPSSLLPTILSRGNLFIQRIKSPLDQPIEVDENIKNYAKQIISARDTDLVQVVNGMLNDKLFKKDTRGYALKTCETAIEILYKSYFATSNKAFLRKLPKLITTYNNLKQNGHIKLHLIADLC